jgi:hypothetical protein
MQISPPSKKDDGSQAPVLGGQEKGLERPGASTLLDGGLEKSWWRILWRIC